MRPRLDDISIIAWLAHNRMRTETGEPLDFRNHLFLYDIYRDWSPKLVCKKAAQIGFTTLAIFKSLYAVEKKKLDSIYTLPTDEEMRVVMGGKVNRIINQNPVLQTAVKNKDSVEQKQIGNNMIYFRGTWGERAAITHSSDLNIHDEASRSKADVVELYESRLQHSKKQWQWIFSNPAVKGDITDRYWEKSDRKEWFITCPECDFEQFLSWPDSIDKELKAFVCKGCGSVLADETRRKGNWKPTAKGEWSGYHISLLMAPWVTAAKIIEYSQTKSNEQFYNFVLGEPFIGQGNTVTEDLFWRNLTETLNAQKRPVIGCDSGIKKHFVVGNEEGLFWYGVTEDWEDVARMLMRWKDAVLVVDAMPDITGPRALRERFRGRVFLNHYAKDRKTMQLIRWGEGDEHGNVVSDRNRLIQLVVDEFTDNRIPLQGTQSDWSDFVSHWRTLFRQQDVDTIGNPTFEWLSSNGLDHWVHATSYWRIGMDRFGKGTGKIIGASNPLAGIKEGAEFSLDGKTVKTYIGKPKPIPSMPSFWNREMD